MINKQLINLSSPASSGGGTGNQEEGLILHLDANDVDSYDGDGSEWVDITNHEYTPATNVSEHFNTVTFSAGTSGTEVINDVGFQPDFVWVKARNQSWHHRVFDSLRGVSQPLYSNETWAQGYNTDITLASFDTEGFTFNNYQTASNQVAWCFKAGGAAVSNTDGTITSQVSANNDLGFSIVKWSGDAGSDSIGHGLGVKPEIVIRKNLVSNSSWAFDTSAIDGSWDYLFLDTTAAKGNHSSIQLPSSTTFDTSGTLYNSSSMIAYCFASKRGVSKVGSYTGKTGSVNVYTGFEPAFLLIKKTNTSTNGDWSIFDNARVNGTVKGHLYANDSYAENDRDGLISFNRDGFTLENNTVGQVNANGDSYIYYAVAKNTNETSLIPDTDLELHLDADSFPQYGEAGYSNTPSTWTDSSGNSNNGTISGAIFDSELGNWLDFDGSNDNVSISGSLGIGVNDYTYEIWFNADTVSLANQNLITTSTDHLNYGLQVNTTGVGMYSLNASGGASYLTSSTGLLSANTWYHLAYVKSSTLGHTLYLNGESIANNPAFTGDCKLGTGSLVKIGSAVNNIQWFNGQIGQVRTYSSALSQNQIRQNYNYTKPSYPNGNNGTIVGPQYNTNGWFDFDGTSDEISIPSTTDFNATSSNPVSMGGWFYMTASGLNSFWSKGSGSGSTAYEYFCFSSPSNGASSYISFSSYLNGAGQATLFYGDSSIVINTWYHVVVTLDTQNQSAKLYVNGGAPKVTDTSFSASSIGTAPLLIGRRGDLSWDLDGRCSKFKFYNRILTQTEVQAMYDEGQ